jgi:phosphoglycolate phosphatase
MSPSPPPVAVFDLDGTLADTAPDLIATLNVVMDGEGLPHVPFEVAREIIGAGARAMIEAGMTSNRRDVTPERIEELFLVFLAHYAKNLSRHSRLFEGVEAALDALEAQGFKLAVCTNKVEGHSVALLRDLGIAERFAAICGRDTFPYFKPDPRHLTMTIDAAAGSLAGSVMVGDSRTDIATAKAAGIPVVAVDFGYTDVPVSELGPDIVISRFADLPEAVRAVRREPPERMVGATGIEPVTLRV